jgi:hypothetical protein
MLLDEAIYNHLSGVAAIIALVPATSIQWIDAELETTIPRIVFRRISAPAMYDAYDQWQRWEIVTVHQDKWSCRQIANLVSDNLNRFKTVNEGLFGGAGGMSIDYIEKIEDPDPTLREDGRYEVIQEFRFIFH